VHDLPVLSQVEPGAIRASLPSAPPDGPEPFSAVLDDLDNVLLPGLTHWQSPRFFAYFATTGAEPGVLAELLIAGLNQVGILWRTSPALQELEELTVDWLRQLVGLPEAFAGHIEDTASTGVLAAAIVARSRRPDRRVLVCSEHAHSVGEKAARLLELELRKVPTDDAFRMRPDLIGAEDACAVIATIGTTGMTSVDPVPEIAQRCADAGTWLHVDAAYAGSAAILPELGQHFAGWELADSIGVNPHKWLGVPMDCSVLWTRRQEAFRNAFSLVPEFLRSPDDALNLSEVSIPLGRRFRALKLWTVLRCYGRNGLQERLREHLRLAQLFEGWVRDEPGWEVTAPRHFSLVCFRREGSDEDNERLLERVNESGEVFLSHTRFADRYQLRLAVGSFRTTEDDVRLAWDVLRREAAAL
jgi:aromatic-L-amino-acid decarboxylase